MTPRRHENNPLVNDLRARAGRVKESAENDRDHLLASLGEFMADVYESGGPQTIDGCNGKCSKHWAILYGVVAGVAAVVSTILHWVSSVLSLNNHGG